MPGQIILTVITGPHRDQNHVFDRPMRCLTGRGPDCEVRLSGDERDMLISRHHCLLNVDPPHIRVADLGSRNGTYINGRPVEKCRNCTAGDRTVDGCAGALLRDGDVLTIGGSSFSVSIMPEEQEVPRGGRPVWACLPRQVDIRHKVDLADPTVGDG